MNQITVLIIGAGPVGMTLAIELARRNVDFRIIDRLDAAPQGSCAKGLQPRSLEILNDLGIAEQLIGIGSTELPYRKIAGGQLIAEHREADPLVMIPVTLILYYYHKLL